MKSAIERVYYGDTGSDVPATDEWKEIAAEYKELYEEFYKSLTETQKEQYDKLSNYMSEQEADRIKQIYKEGFKLGLSVAAESLI